LPQKRFLVDCSAAPRGKRRGRFDLNRAERASCEEIKLYWSSSKSEGESLLGRELSIWKRRLSWLQVFRIGVRLISMWPSLTGYISNPSTR
jgi:hypothetical protein